MNKYEIFIPSKARSEKCLTADILTKWDIPFTIVVEPQDLLEYQNKYSPVVSLDKNDMGLSYARNYIKNRLQGKGEKYHWQLDDDIKFFQIRVENKNVTVNPLKLIQVVEDYIAQFPNVAISGLRDSVYAWTQKESLSYNKVIASAVLVKNNTPMGWRENMIEDMAYCLDSLLNNYCTVIFNRFSTEKTY